MLKELVAKRMLKLQHSAVYSETVTALQRKIAILERRNVELEDKADRLETNMMSLFSEVGASSFRWQLHLICDVARLKSHLCLLLKKKKNIFFRYMPNV